MIHQELLRRAVAGRHPAIQRFVETLAPQLLLAFSSTPALGGSGRVPTHAPEPILPPEAVAHTPEARARFSQSNPDQSLSAHLFNGIFAGARIAEQLPATKQLRDIEWQIWILGFIVHDYTKIHGIAIEPRYMPQIRSIIEDQGERLNFAAFLPTWHDYLDEITFLAQNTQKVQGAAMNWSLFPGLRLDQRRLMTLRYLASFADLLVHITRPSDVAERTSRGRNTAQNLDSTLGQLFGIDRRPRLAYHQLTEARGLLSNLINNSLMHARELQGYQPYLFFPDGVVYLVPGGESAQLDAQLIVDSLWREVGATLAGLNDTPATSQDEEQGGEEEEREGGLRISRTKDYMKVPPVLYELLNPRTLLSAARQSALGIRRALNAERMGAEVADDQGIATTNMKPQAKKELFSRLGNELQQREGLPGDVRVDQLAEYLAFIWRRMLREWFPKADWSTKLLLDRLRLSDLITPERAEASRGGTPTGWFYVAACYLKRERLDPEQLEARMVELGEQVLSYLAERQLTPSIDGRFERAFRDYVQATISVDGTMLYPAEELRERFVREVVQYRERKATNKVQCSLCSSPYEARSQDKSEVLFKPQQYSNKTRLDTATVVRGICPICALELMLRQVQQGMRAGSAQDERPITLWLYPTYFFTAETARVVQGFVSWLRDLNLLDMIKQLDRQQFDLATLATYTSFMALEEDEEERREYSLRKPTFAERDPASLFFFTLRPAMKKPTETDAWIIPIFYSLALPLLLDLKLVVTASFVPLFSSGAEFRGTTIIDAPHSFTTYILDGDELRLDQLETQLWRLLRLYQLHLDVFASATDFNWGLLNSVAKEIATDPLAVFSYYDRKQRSGPTKEQPEQGKKGKGKAKAPAKAEGSSTTIPSYVVTRYMAIYETLRRDSVTSFIAQLVDDYAQFYRADYAHLGSAYTVLRPLGTAIDITKNSSPHTDDETLILLIAGAINDELDRVRNDAATSGGFDPIVLDKSLGSYPERLERSRAAIAHFAHQFVEHCFKAYCKGDRGILRERANRIRSAANFHYLSQSYARPRSSQNSTVQE
jgi:CRISPR-associated protein Csc3